MATHLATALVLLGFFWKDLVRIVRGIARSLNRREIGDDADARLGWLLVVGTIPAGLLGLLLEHTLRSVFASPRSAPFFLMINGLMLHELLCRRAPQEQAELGNADGRVARLLTWRSAVGIGVAQAIALIPSIGDLLSQDRSLGGLGLGTVVTSVIFLTTILALVVYLSVTRSAEIAPEPISA